MKTVGVGEVKAHFSDILEQVKGGDKIAVAYGKKKKKVAVIVPYDEYRPRAQRRLGLLQSKSAKANLSATEANVYRKLARIYLDFSDADMARLRIAPRETARMLIAVFLAFMCYSYT